MERGKCGPGRSAKNKIAAHPSDFIALGTKNIRGDLPDSKRPGGSLIKSSAGPSSLGSDRKKEASTSIQSLIPSKKPKLSHHGSSIHSRAPSNVEAWESLSKDYEPVDLVPLVLEASDNDEGDKIVGAICGAIKALKLQKLKPDPIIYMGLLYLAKIRPSIFTNDSILQALSSLLKRDQGHLNKTKGYPMLSVLAANLLMRGFHAKKNWPEALIKLYIDDALGERVWVDHEECKIFVDNILTGFNTRIPPKTLLQPELPITTSRECQSPITLDDDNPDALTIHLPGEDKLELSIGPRFAHCTENIESIVLDVVKEQINRRQPDSITRNFLKLLSSTCGFVEIRNIAVTRLDTWLHNPKLMRQAQELLCFICYNCTKHTKRDVEVISQLVKMRLKTKAVINSYLNGVKEMISLHPDNLATITKHTIYNELSTARNPNNLPMLGVIFQTSPDKAAKLLAEIFQDLLMNREDYLKPIRALFREIIRACRYDFNMISLAQTLMAERADIAQQLHAFEFKERMFLSIIDILCMSMFLAVSPQVKDTALAVQKGEKRNLEVIYQFHHIVTVIQSETIRWLHCGATQMYGIKKTELLLSAFRKILLLEPLEQYHKPDNWPAESERSFFTRLFAEVPLMQSMLMRLLVVGATKDGIKHGEIINMIDQLVRRAAVNSRPDFPTLMIIKEDVIEFILRLCAYQPPDSINFPTGYVPPTFAISNLYWKGWIILLILSAHNPSTLGEIMWKRYPILRTMMEMCITSHFSYPPPTMALPENVEEERAKELQIVAIEKQDILEFENHLAAGSSNGPVSEQNALLLSQLITMDPTGFARTPPPDVLQQIELLNGTHRLGHLLCLSRKPDFLLDIIQRQQQSSSQSMPWLADLVQNYEDSWEELPVQCLCESLLFNTAQVEKQPRQQQLIAHLRTLLTDPNQDQHHSYEVLEYFLRRLSSQQSASRVQAITGLQLILDSITLEEEMEVDDQTETCSQNLPGCNKSFIDHFLIQLKQLYDSSLPDCSQPWLLKKLPSIPHFLAVRSLVSAALRAACQVENNPDLVRAYISFLATHTVDDDLPDLINLVNEISQLVVERTTIIASILPQTAADSPQTRHTLHSFMTIFCNYIDKARVRREDVSRVFTWYESQDLILVEWSSGEQCTMHILVIHAMIILLTFDQTDNEALFHKMLETWFPSDSEPPKAFLVDTCEEALLIPDWLKLRMIRSNIPRLVDAALKDLEPQQLVLFIQSFGVPVSAMTKLLHILDAAVKFDPAQVGEAVLDKTYMSQLVKILHKRGATGGHVFMQVLQLHEAPPPDEIISSINMQLEPFPSWQDMQNQKECIEFCVKTDVPHLINRVFIESLPMSQKQDSYRKLHKTLARDIQKSTKESGAVIVAIQHICSVLDSMQVKQFLASLVHLPQFSCTLMRVILVPLKSKANATVRELALNMCITLISLIGNVQAPIVSILRDFASVHVSKVPTYKELATLTQTRDPASILESTNSQNLERLGRKLLDICLKQQKNDALVEAMTRLLVTDSEESVKPRTGLLIDWMASVEPELIGICPTLQLRLLFGKKSVNVKLDDSVVNSHSCRPYLLTLLTHRASWATISKCVNNLLDECHSGYDPTAVLDFLWALTCNPKLWQGRDKFTPKHYIPENILLLTEKQLLILVAYLIEEAVILCNRESRTAAVTQMGSRLDLILHCVSMEDGLTASIVKHLTKQPADTKDVRSDMAHQFLLHLYMKIPKVVYYLECLQKKKFLGAAKIKDWTGSVLDCMSHALLTALAATPNRQKSWNSKSLEFELCARKMAAVHPILVLRQLPMLASSLMGRSYLDFNQFKSYHHLNLFTQIMGLLELLQPYLFNEEHRAAFEDILDIYIQCFHNYRRIKELSSLLNRFATILQSYVNHDERNALKYMQKHAHVLRELQESYLSLTSLRSLVSGMPKLREGEAKDQLPITIIANRNNQPESLIPMHWSSLLTTLLKLHGDEVLSALQEIEHVSFRKPSVLEPILDNISNLLVSPQENIRTSAHVLIIRALKHKPTPNFSVLCAYQRCLDSPKSDVLMSALERLPDIILCMQEYAMPLMQKVFELGVNSNVNTTAYINKSIALLNMQQGC